MTTTTAANEESPGHRRLGALSDLNEARHRQVEAEAAMPAEAPDGRPVMLSEAQLLAADAVEDAERAYRDATAAWIRSDGFGDERSSRGG